MANQRFILPFKILALLLPSLGKIIIQRVLGIPHSLTYRATLSPKNIVIIGGSFSGISLVQRLVRCLPSGYRIVWIERNSHLHYLFAFPRFSVVPGLEQLGFIPYDGIEKNAVQGILVRKRGEVVSVEEGEVVLETGERVGYEFLVVATGSTQAGPVGLLSKERLGGCQELREVQEVIGMSEKIAVVGGGAVGVELASDIKDFYPEKDVTLVHSRGQLLNQFGRRLQDYVLEFLREKLHVRVLLNERPDMSGEENMARSPTLTFSDGSEEKFDLVVSILSLFDLVMRNAGLTTVNIMLGSRSNVPANNPTLPSSLRFSPVPSPPAMTASSSTLLYKSLRQTHPTHSPPLLPSLLSATLLTTAAHTWPGQPGSKPK